MTVETWGKISLVGNLHGPMSCSIPATVWASPRAPCGVLVHRLGPKHATLDVMRHPTTICCREMCEQLDQSLMAMNITIG